MLNYKPPPVRASMIGQAGPRLSAPPALTPPPLIDPIYNSFDGISGVVETVVVLGILSASSWISIRAAISQASSKSVHVAGWVGGIGSALLGLLYLGGKSGYNGLVSLPAVRVTPS